MLGVGALGAVDVYQDTVHRHGMHGVPSHGPARHSRRHSHGHGALR